MNRREATKTIGLVALGATVKSWSDPAAAQEVKDSQMMRLPRSVAGVRIVDSKIATEATELSRSSSPTFLFNHCMRTFLFGSLAGKAAGKRFDEETFYVACILHDLGLTDMFMGDLPFEIQGAEAAKKFLLGKGMDPDRASTVWDGIAMHVLAIGRFRLPEIALVGAGAGADVLGPDATETSQHEIEEILSAFPRLGFKKQFVQSCADAVRKHPRTASGTFMRDIAERNVPDFKARNICDLIERAPFKE